MEAKKPFKYVNCNSKGISRIQNGEVFEYYDQKNVRIVDPSVLSRIHSLVIPPNWNNVWICPNRNGHIQATGLDIRQRKQYIYHPRWTAFQDQDKFSRLYHFGKSLPVLKKQLEKDIKRDLCDQRYVCALAIMIIQHTSIRPGNTIYRNSNGSFGLTTLQNKHVKLQQGKVILRYRGKKGVKQEKAFSKKRLYDKIEKILQLSGKQFLQYLDEQNVKRAIKPCHLNSYLSEIYGGNVTSKTIRTWNACFLALGHLLETYPGNTKNRNKSCRELVSSVAHILGNTPSVARKNYICPVILKRFEEGSLDGWMRRYANIAKKEKDTIVQKKLLMLLKGC
ncbi:DNA topoisomerase IB [Sphingobacterium cellulitidis]|uniref:DNA topoisomerase IB n=1 Tax=Sphingobacterium cellulitidis TaxID=1768011 RepID=UPI000B93D48E|nr:hypothetical protein CHT99_17205 [Sphingobacterium cellulitidis]